MEQTLLPHAQAALEELQQGVVQLNVEISRLDEERKQKKALRNQYEAMIRKLKGEKTNRGRKKGSQATAAKVGA